MHNVYGCIAHPCDKPRAKGSAYCPKCDDKAFKERMIKSLKDKAAKKENK